MKKSKQEKAQTKAGGAKMSVRKLFSDSAHNAPKNLLQECFDDNLPKLLNDVKEGKPGATIDLHSQLLFAAKHDLAIPNQALVVLLETKFKTKLTPAQSVDLEALYHIETIRYYEVAPCPECFVNQYLLRPFTIKNKRHEKLTFAAACGVYHRVLLDMPWECLSQRHRFYLAKNENDFWETMKGKKKSLS